MKKKIYWQKQEKDSKIILYVGKIVFSCQSSLYKVSEKNIYLYLRYKDLLRFYSEDFIRKSSLEELVSDIFLNHFEIVIFGKRRRKVTEDLPKLGIYEMLEFNKEYVFETKDMTYLIKLEDY